MNLLIHLALLFPATPQVELVSTAAIPQDALPGNFAGMSDDGRFALMLSQQPNVVPGQIDPENGLDLFLIDRTTGTTRLVTHTGDQVTAMPGNFGAQGTISGDGSVVVFATIAPSIVPGFDSNGQSQAYLYQVSTGDITPLTRSSGNPTLGANGSTTGMTVDRQGTRAVVVSRATDLVPGFVDGGLGPDLFAIDLISGATTLITRDHASPQTGSRAPDSRPAAHQFSIDDSGTTILLTSNAENLVPSFQSPTSPFSISLFVHDVPSAQTTLISHEAGTPNVAAALGITVAGMSADGQRLYFGTSTTNIVSGQSNPVPGGQLYLHERATGVTRLISHAASDATEAANGVFTTARISADGEKIAFSHSGTNLMAGVTDVNAEPDIFIYNVAAGATERLLTHRAGQPLVTSAERYAGSFEMSGDGSLVGLNYRSTDWVSGFSQGSTGTPFNSYAYDLVTGVRSLLSRSAASSTIGANSSDSIAAVSRDGATILRKSSARNLGLGTGCDGPTLIATQHPSGNSAYAFTAAGTPSASANGESRTATGVLNRFRITSQDGRWSVFLSLANNLTPSAVAASGDTNLYLTDRETGQTRLINHSGDGVSATGQVSAAEISADGSTVIFWGRDMTDVVPGFAATSIDSVFAYDVAAGTSALISGRGVMPDFESNNDSFAWSMSRDGRFVVLSTRSSDIVTGVSDLNGTSDIVLVDRLLGTRTLVTAAIAPGGTTANRGGTSASISPDGTTVAYQSHSRDLIAGFIDNNQPQNGDVFSFDVATGTTRLVSHAFGSPLKTGDGLSSGTLVANGGSIVFSSTASDLVPGFVDQNGSGRDIFRADSSGNVHLGVEDPLQPLAGLNDFSLPTHLSSDGSTIGFYSFATNAVPGFIDSNGPTNYDLYVTEVAQGRTKLVSRQLTGAQVGSDTRTGDLSISDNGQRVLWSTGSTNVVVNQPTAAVGQNLFLTEVSTGAVRLVTERTTASQGIEGISSRGFFLSGDGSTAVFSAVADNFVSDDFNLELDVFRVDLGRQCAGIQVCGTTPNSVGQGALLCLTGSELATANLFTVSVGELPPNRFGLMIASMETGFVANPGGSLGNLCINGPSLGRYVNAIQNSGAAGSVSMNVDLARIPSGGGLTAATAGSVFAWQYWYRDVVGGAAVSNLSDASIVRFR